MKKLVSLLAVGALSVGFADEGASDDTDYLTGLHSSETSIIYHSSLNLAGNDKVGDITALLKFWSEVAFTCQKKFS